MFDKRANLVYTDCAKDQWPVLVGTVEVGNRLQPKRTSSEADLFASLDGYLREEKVRLKELFMELDVNRRGAIDASGTHFSCLTFLQTDQALSITP